MAEAAARPDWDPAQYGRFAAERARPGLDLLARLADETPNVVVDLGCGPGYLTARLQRQWPRAHVLGIDSSPQMLAAARRDHPGLAWQRADIADWRPDRPPDLIFANASLHWLPDHAALLPRLLGSLAAGGVLAVQMPRSHDLPSHVAMRQAAADFPATAEMASRADPVATPQAYYDLLAPHAAALDIWEVDYLHALQGDDAVVEWTKGTGLRPLLKALGDEAEAFLARYRALIAAACPRRADGVTLYPFRRLFIVGRR